jgi:hypothetical protein
MRMLRRIILAVTTILAVAPATAQRYDPRYRGRLHRHRLQLYIIGSVQDDGVGTLSYVLRQPILAASTSGVAGRRPSATRPRLLGDCLRELVFETKFFQKRSFLTLE